MKKLFAYVVVAAALAVLYLGIRGYLFEESSCRTPGITGERWVLWEKSGIYYLSIPDSALARLEPLNSFTVSFTKVANAGWVLKFDAVDIDDGQEPRHSQITAIVPALEISKDNSTLDVSSKEAFKYGRVAAALYMKFSELKK